MSHDEPKLSRKDRRAQRDAERFKSKKRKHAETIDDEEEPPTAEQDGDTQELEQDFIGLPVEASSGAKTQDAKKPKKRKISAATANVDAVPEDSSTKKSRFICFVGNLPYNTTDDSLRKHFKSLQPFTLRHRLDKETKKSKGFAFLEFENYDRMKTCLKQYHHTMFDPATAGQDLQGTEEGAMKSVQAGDRKGKKSGARKINVELTAGGGGAGEARKEKVRLKNERLEGQRQRRAEQEKKEKDRKERKKAKSAGGVEASVAEAPAESEDAGEENTGMHPARLAMLQR